MKTLRTVSRFAVVPAVCAFCLFSLVGCDVTTWSGKESARGKELESILTTKRQILTTAPADLPLSFDAVEVDKTTDKDNGVMYSAALVWKLTGTPEQLRDKLGLTNQADVAVKEVVLRIAYLDAKDQPCGEDRVELELQNSDKVPQSRGVVHLSNLGETGSPVRAVATLDSFTMTKGDAKVAAK
jgi:hypothetical protein